MSARRPLFRHHTPPTASPATGRSPRRAWRPWAATLALVTGLLLGAGTTLTGIAVSETTPTSTNPRPPLVTTGATETVTRTTATLLASVTPRDAATSYQFEYGTSTSYGLTTASVNLPAGDDAVAVKVPVTGLTQATKYNYRVVATNAAGTARGSNQTFDTVGAPLITSRAAWDVAGDRASVGATITPRGATTTYRIQWGTTSKFGRYTARKTLSERAHVGVPIAEQLTGLKSNTKYYFRATATNEVGTVYGATRNFTTPRTITGVTAQLSTTKVAWGSKVTLTGSVGGGGVSGTKLSIWRVDFPFTGAPWQAGTATANSAGNYSLSVGPLYATTRLYAVTQTSTPLTSPTVTAGGAALTKLRVDKRRAKQMRLRGQLFPALSSARVSIQRQTPKGRWTRIKRVGVEQINANSVGFRAWVPRIKGRTAIYRFVVLPNDGGAHVQTESQTVAVPARR